MDSYNDWHDRRDDRRRNERPIDESQYRGAYRLDEDGHYSTYNRNRQGDRGRDSYNDNQGGDYVYRRSRNLQDNDDYTERQYQRSYHSDTSRQNDRDTFGGRHIGDAGMHDDRSRYNERSGGGRSGRQEYSDGHSRSTAGNFDGDYRPDTYRRGREENYGNMAGSLSYGYDGDRNSDPDYNRSYNPLTGEMRQRHNQDSRQNQPRHYGPPDRTGSNPDYDRY